MTHVYFDHNATTPVDAPAVGRLVREGLLAYRALAGQYDMRHGGFGSAPKFPPTMTLDFLLRHGAGQLGEHGGVGGVSLVPTDVFDGVSVEPTDETFRSAARVATEGRHDSFVAVGGF